MIFHSDRGCQYTSAAFARYCTAHGIVPSVGRTGVCWGTQSRIVGEGVVLVV